MPEIDKGNNSAKNVSGVTIFNLLLRARRNEKELKVKPATSFKYFQYLLTKN